MIVHIGGQAMHVSALQRMGAVTATWTLSTASALQCDTGFTLSLPVATRKAPPRRRFGQPRDFSQPVRTAAGLSVAVAHSGVSARWRPLPVRLVPRVVRRQSRLA